MKRSSRGRVAARAVVILILCAPVAPVPANARQLGADLLPAAEAVRPGERMTIGVELKTDPGWHVYWRNPGDAGLATRLTWGLPAGVRAGAPRWPAPVAFGEPPVVGFGYEGTTILLVDLYVSPDVPPGSPLPVGVVVEGLLCSDECLPARAEARVLLRVEAAACPAPAATRSRLARYEALVPRADPSWSITATATADGVVLRAKPPPGGDAREQAGGVRFYPYEGDAMDHAGSLQTATPAGGVYRLALKRSDLRRAPPERLRGALVVVHGKGAPPLAAVEVDVPVTVEDEGANQQEESKP